MYLRHGSGQYSVVNSTALDIAEIDSNTADPFGSRILHDENGEPNGILSHYPAENLVAEHATGYGDRTEEQKVEDIEKGQEMCLSAGYTTIQDVIVGTPKDLQQYKSYADSGRLKVRLYTMLYVNTTKQAANYAQQYYNEHTPTLSDRYRFGGWKLAQDGRFAAKTILMYNKALFAASLSYPILPRIR